MKRTEKHEIRLTVLEKELLEAKAKAAGTNKSALIRALLESDDKIVVLGSGQEILSELYQIRTRLEACLALKTLSVVDAAALRDGMSKIAALLCTIAESLSDFNDDEGEEADDVDS